MRPHKILFFFFLFNVVMLLTQVFPFHWSEATVPCCHHFLPCYRDGKGQVVCHVCDRNLWPLSQVPGLSLLRDIYKAWISWSNTDKSVCGGSAGCWVGRRSGRCASSICRRGWRLCVCHWQGHRPGHGWRRRWWQHGSRKEWIVHLALAATIGV